MRKIILSGLGILLIIVAIWGAKKLIDNKNKPKPVINKTIQSVLIDTVQNHTIPIVIPASGKLVAKERIELYAEVQGIFKKGSHLFKPGQVYNKGAYLIKIDASEHYANVQSAKSNLYNNITSVMPDLKLDFPKIYLKWETYLRSFKMDSTTPILPKLENDKENYFITGRGIISSYYNVKNLEQRLSKYHIKAPFSGILTSALVTEGSLIRNGQKLGEFINPNLYELEVYVSKSFVKMLKIGQQVALTNLDKTENYSGTISRINGSIDPATQTVGVYFEIKDKSLKEGAYLEALIAARKVENAIEVNRNLLINNKKIFRITNGKLETMIVNPIYFSETKVILQNIPNGTVILKTPIAGAYPGMLVTPFKEVY